MANEGFVERGPGAARGLGTALRPPVGKTPGSSRVLRCFKTLSWAILVRLDIHVFEER